MANADVFASMGKKPMGGMQTTYDEGAETGPIKSSAPAPAPVAPEAPPAAPTEVGRFAGSGKYEYAEMSDGTIKITKSTRGGEGTIVPQDSPFYDLIKADIAKFNAPGAKAPASKPAAPKAAAPKAAPAPAAAPDMGTSEQEMPDLGYSEDVADAMLEMPTSEAGTPVPTPMSAADKRRELAQYGNSIPGSIKRAGLAEDARAGLVKSKMDAAAADTVVRQLMKQMMGGDYNSYTTLKNFAKM